MHVYVCAPPHKHTPPRRICKFACLVKSLRVFPLMVQKAVTGESLKQFGFNFLFKRLEFESEEVWFSKKSSENEWAQSVTALSIVGTKHAVPSVFNPSSRQSVGVQLVISSISWLLFENIPPTISIDFSSWNRVAKTFRIQILHCPIGCKGPQSGPSNAKFSLLVLSDNL